MITRHSVCGRIPCVSLLGLLLWVGTALGQQSESPANLEERIDKLILQLGDQSPEVRAQATTDLIKIGQPAVAKLAVATKEATLEVGVRADEILQVVSRSVAGLKFSSQIKSTDLQGAVTLELSPDGKFIYVPAHISAAINVFYRNSTTGELTHVQTIQDRVALDGVVVLRQNGNGKLAAAAAVRAKTVALYSRDELTGQLTLLSMRRRQEPSGELNLMEWPTELTFSTDDKFLYVADDREGSITVFRIVDKKDLYLVEIFKGPDGCLNGARGITAHPDGKTLYASSHRAGTLIVFNRDTETGRISIRQTLRDEEDGVHGLAGTVDSYISRDGRFVYTASGRWEGDDAIGVFQVGSEGKLTVLQEFINDKSELRGFSGGAKGMAISPDGKRFYGSGAKSASLACFNRDPETGKLTYVTTLQNMVTGSGIEKKPYDNLGANGIGISKDGRYVYLALENGAAITVLEWTPPEP